MLTCSQFAVASRELIYNQWIHIVQDGFVKAVESVFDGYQASNMIGSSPKLLPSVWFCECVHACAVRECIDITSLWDLRGTSAAIPPPQTNAFTISPFRRAGGRANMRPVRKYVSGAVR